jgi:hypothetical protein
MLLRGGVCLHKPLKSHTRVDVLKSAVADHHTISTAVACFFHQPTRRTSTILRSTGEGALDPCDANEIRSVNVASKYVGVHMESNVPVERRAGVHTQPKLLDSNSSIPSDDQRRPGRVFTPTQVRRPPQHTPRGWTEGESECHLHAGHLNETRWLRESPVLLRPAIRR